jgi:long-chain acyl-CoA synthetase
VGANSPEWVAAALGAILRGAVIVPADAEASAGFVRRMAESVQPALILHGPGQEPSDLPVASVSLTAALEHPGSERRPDGPTVGRDDPALILYTSGTTSQPRGVILTHGNLLTQAAVFRRWGLLTRWWPVRLLALSPLSHIQGFLIGLVVPLTLGLSVLYSVSVEPTHVIHTIRQNRVHLLLAVPRVQQLLARTLRHLPYRGGPRTIGERAGALRFFPLRRHVLFRATHAELGYTFWALLVGGAPLEPDDERFWYECGYVLVQGYGLTETSALVSVNVNGPFRARLGSVGKPLPHHQLQLAADGEICVRGPGVSPGLFEHADRSAYAADGWLRTGDLAAQDSAGKLWFRGRKEDVIVTSAGLNVHPEDVEVTLRRCTGVRDAVVLGLGNGSHTEVHAVLLLQEGTPAHEAVGEANRALEPHQRIQGWTVWPAEDFPRTSLHKVRRADLAGAVRDGLAPSLAPVLEAPTPPQHGEIRAEPDRRRRLGMLARHLADRTEEADPDQANLLMEDLGLGSLDVVELLTLVEGLRSRPLTGLTVTPRTSVSELADMARSPTVPHRGRALPERQPAWSDSSAARLLRRVSQPLLIGTWSRSSIALAVEAAVPAGALPRPAIIAATPHHHWLDVFAVQAALPGRWPTVTVTNRDFSEYFAPSPGIPRRTRVSVGLAYYALMPLCFDFAIIPNYGSTRAGLYELGRAIERGLSPIVFPRGLAPPGTDNRRHEPGVAMMAIESGLPLIPVVIEGNDHLRVWPAGRRARVTVRLGTPLAVGPGADAADLIERLEAAYDRLVRGGGEQR